MINPDPLELEIWVPGTEWIPVRHEDPPHDDLGSLISDTARVLAEVGLGYRLRWKAVPGLAHAGELPGELPDSVDGPPAIPNAWMVWMLPGSVVLLGGTEQTIALGPPLTDGHKERVAMGARLTLSRSPTAVMVRRPLHRDRVVTTYGTQDRALERLVIEAELLSDTVDVIDVTRPAEFIVVGRSIGIAWPGRTADDPPHVLWTSLSAARALTPPDLRHHLPAVVRAGVQHLGLDLATAPIADYHPDGWPPALDYSALLDPGERVALSLTVIPRSVDVR